MSGDKPPLEVSPGLADIVATAQVLLKAVADDPSLKALVETAYQLGFCAGRGYEQSVSPPPKSPKDSADSWVGIA